MNYGADETEPEEYLSFKATSTTIEGKFKVISS